jgi:hypothetical protein
MVPTLRHDLDDLVADQTLQKIRVFKCAQASKRYASDSESNVSALPEWQRTESVMAAWLKHKLRSEVQKCSCRITTPRSLGSLIPPRDVLACLRVSHVQFGVWQPCDKSGGLCDIARHCCKCAWLPCLRLLRNNHSHCRKQA